MSGLTPPSLLSHPPSSPFFLQNKQRASVNTTALDRRLRFLEARHAEADVLLHVHASLLFELQVQLRNLSASFQQQQEQRPGGCGVARRPTLLGMRDFLPPGWPAASRGRSSGWEW